MKKWLLLLVLGALMVPGLPDSLSAQLDDSRKVKNATGKSCGDGIVPAWVLPGNFSEVLARARKERRCFIIKGIAFGVDKLGASCPTRGHW